MKPRDDENRPLTRFERFEKWANSPTEKAKRVSGADVEAAFEEKAKKRQAKKGSREKFGWRFYIGLAMGIAGVSLALFGTMGAPINRDAEIRALNQQISKARNANDEVVANKTEAKTSINKAMEASKAVTELQNSYRGWQTSTSDADANRVLKLHNDLAKYIPSDAAVRWYDPFIKNNKGKVEPLPAADYSWQHTMTYDVTSTSQVPVSWLCKDKKSNNLLAWAIGIYDPKTGKFSEITKGRTIIGNKYLLSDDTSGSTEK